MEKQVTLLSEGQEMFGILHLPDSSNSPAPGHIMCHGFTGHKAEAQRIHVITARRLAARGVASLRFDFRGNGDSPGEFRDVTISREVIDAQFALDYLAGLPEVDENRLGVTGLSMGGCVGACLAGRDPRVKALVLWSAAGDMKRIYEKYLELFEDRPFFDNDGFELSRALLDDFGRLQPFEELKNYAGPGLIIHGSNDEIVPPSEARDFADVLASRARLHIIDGADHVFASLPWMEEVIGLTCDFLIESLNARPDR
jgi:pimeloyl-ACP methyl ester carboxylesterase